MDTCAVSRPTHEPHAVGEVLVTSRHRVVAQAVTAGLGQRRGGVRTADWAPGEWQRLMGGEALMVVIDDLDSRSAVDTVAVAVSNVVRAGARVLVLTDSPPGPAWGAVLDAGASGVMTSDCSLDELEEGIEKVVASQPLVDPRRRTELEEQWLEWLVEEQGLRERLEALSPRETSVLAMLAQGHRVADIGQRLGVREGTVRSHVRSLRRKLQVDSQLGAVAIARRVAGRLPERPAPPRPRRPLD
jgi:DNA-binding NarL/FixJ family response regulator